MKIKLAILTSGNPSSSLLLWVTISGISLYRHLLDILLRPTYVLAILIQSMVLGAQEKHDAPSTFIL